MALFGRTSSAADDLEEIVVTGVRASVEESLEAKRQTLSLVEVISAEDIGSVSSGTCLPTGSSFQPLLSRNPPPGNGPTRSCGAGCDPSTAAIRINAAASDARTVFSIPNRRWMTWDESNR